MVFIVFVGQSIMACVPIESRIINHTKHYRFVLPQFLQTLIITVLLYFVESTLKMLFQYYFEKFQIIDNYYLMHWSVPFLSSILQKPHTRCQVNFFRMPYCFLSGRMTNCKHKSKSMFVS